MCLKYSKFYNLLLLFCFRVHHGRASIILTTTVSNSVNQSCIDEMFCPDGYKCDFEVNMCIPHCSIDCGLGSCIGPEECKCDEGYYIEALMDDSEPPRCKPVCEFCEGTCVRPYTCVCEPEFGAINVSADGGDCDCFGNCTGRICESTKCVPRSTIKTITNDFITSSNSETSTILYEDVTEGNILVTFGTAKPEEDYSYELFSTSADKNQYYLDPFLMSDTENELREANVSGSSNTWIYYTAGSVVLMIAVTVLVIKRHAVLSCFRRNSYSLVEVEEKLGTPIHAMDMDFLTIE